MTEPIAPQDEQLAEQELAETSPGELLKASRERMQLSTLEVSEQLNLKHSFVQMMEEDNYNALPGATFIRGYLRVYGKLVDIDPERLIAIYNERFNEEARPEERYRPVDTIKPQRSFSDPLIKYTTLAVVAALITLSILWWQSRNGSDPLSLVQGDTITIETSDGETIVAQMDLSDAEASALEEAPLSAEERSPEPVNESDSNSNSDSGTVSQEEAAEVAPLPVTEAESQNSDSETSARALEEPLTIAAEPDAEIQPAPETSASVMAAQSFMAEERFVITYSEECWVEVTDGRGIKVVSNLKRPGEESLVEGVPPFKLMIGNASGAVVTYKDEVVNLLPHTNRNNIARFTLGE